MKNARVKDSNIEDNDGLIKKIKQQYSNFCLKLEPAPQDISILKHLNDIELNIIIPEYYNLLNTHQ